MIFIVTVGRWIRIWEDGSGQVGDVGTGRGKRQECEWQDGTGTVAGWEEDWTI